MSDKKAPPMPPRPPDDEVVQFGDTLPVLPIRNAVLFPGAVAPFDVGREKSVALVEDIDNLGEPGHRDLRPDVIRAPMIPGQDDLLSPSAAPLVSSRPSSTARAITALILQGI